MAKIKKQTTNNSSLHNKNNDPQVHTPLLANEIKFDNQIDIPNPKLQTDGTLTYSLFGESSSNIDLSPSAITNNAYYRELEKLLKN